MDIILQIDSYTHRKIRDRRLDHVQDDVTCGKRDLNVAESVPVPGQVQCLSSRKAAYFSPRSLHGKRGHR